MKRCAWVVMGLLVVAQGMASAWDVGSFQNDSAVDWVLDLQADATTGVLHSALIDLPPKGDIDVLDCELAMAAAQVVAARRSSSMLGLPEEVVAWLERVRPAISPTLLSEARRAVEVCGRDDRSQLKRGWQPTPLYPRWQKEVEALAKQLR